MNQQLASAALQLVNAAPTRGADAENVAAVKQWLRQIAAGQLAVGKPVSKDAEASETAE